MYLHPKLKTVLLHLLAESRDSLNETTVSQTNQTVVYNPHIATNNWVTLMSSVPIYIKTTVSLGPRTTIGWPGDIINFGLHLKITRDFY